MSPTRPSLSTQLKSFIKKWEGQKPSGYTASGGQCICLVRHWLKIYTGDAYSIPRVLAAKDMYSAASSRKWRKVRYKHGEIPPVGSIVVFDDHPGNQWGHVAIARGGSNKWEFHTFDANWSHYRLASTENHRPQRDRVTGWLIWKG
jgi:hypothetical protein